MASHETTVVAEEAVFVDETGRRRRWLVISGRLGIAAMATAAAVTVAGLVGGARLPFLALPAPLAPAAPPRTSDQEVRATGEAPRPATRPQERAATPVEGPAAARPVEAATTTRTGTPPSRPTATPPAASPPGAAPPASSSPTAAPPGRDTGQPAATPASPAATGRKPGPCGEPPRKRRAAIACRDHQGHRK